MIENKTIEEVLSSCEELELSGKFIIANKQNEIRGAAIFITDVDIIEDIIKDIDMIESLKKYKKRIHSNKPEIEIVENLIYEKEVN